MRKNDRGGSKRGGLSIYKGGRMVPPKACRFFNSAPPIYIYVEKKAHFPSPPLRGGVSAKQTGWGNTIYLRTFLKIKLSPHRGVEFNTPLKCQNISPQRFVF